MRDRSSSSSFDAPYMRSSEKVGGAAVSCCSVVVCCYILCCYVIPALATGLAYQFGSDFLFGNNTSTNSSDSNGTNDDDDGGGGVNWQQWLERAQAVEKYKNKFSNGGSGANDDANGDDDGANNNDDKADDDAADDDAGAGIRTYFSQYQQALKDYGDDDGIHASDVAGYIREYYYSLYDDYAGEHFVYDEDYDDTDDYVTDDYAYR